MYSEQQTETKNFFFFRQFFLRPTHAHAYNPFILLVRLESINFVNEKYLLIFFFTGIIDLNLTFFILTTNNSLITSYEVLSFIDQVIV